MIEKLISAFDGILTGAIKDQCGRYCYSFATKYCSFAATDAMKDQYPIYDSNVAAVYKVRWEIWNPENDRRFHKYDFDAWDENVVRNTYPNLIKKHRFG